MLREHPRKRSLDQVVEAFLADGRARGLSPRTLEHYAWSAASFRASLPAEAGVQVLADLEPDAVRAWVAGLGRTRKAVSVRSAVRGLKVLGRWVAREGYVTADPIASVRLPKAPDALILPLSGDQVATLVEAGSPLLRVAVAILADTGVHIAGSRSNSRGSGQIELAAATRSGGRRMEYRTRRMATGKAHRPAVPHDGQVLLRGGGDAERSAGGARPRTHVTESRPDRHMPSQVAAG